MFELPVINVVGKCEVPGNECCKSYHGTDVAGTTAALSGEVLADRWTNKRSGNTQHKVWVASPGYLLRGGYGGYRNTHTGQRWG